MTKLEFELEFIIGILETAKGEIDEAEDSLQELLELVANKEELKKLLEERKYE